MQQRSDACLPSADTVRGGLSRQRQELLGRSDSTLWTFSPNLAIRSGRLLYSAPRTLSLLRCRSSSIATSITKKRR
jgi:hypothetical protein